MEQAHILVTPTEMDEALLAFLLRQKGFDPAEFTAQGFSVVYRIVDGKVFAAVHIDQVVRSEQAE